MLRVTPGLTPMVLSLRLCELEKSGGINVTKSTSHQK